jgi:hypothetical protein
MSFAFPGMSQANASAVVSTASAARAFTSIAIAAQGRTNDHAALLAHRFSRRGALDWELYN